VQIPCIKEIPRIVIIIIIIIKQKELTFTPVKYATKPNPFKIISLKPTRKENNWETEETMERATVSLETKRAKWPNPGCS
jgi:hypothetical protein